MNPPLNGDGQTMEVMFYNLADKPELLSYTLDSKLPEGVGVWLINPLDGSVEQASGGTGKISVAGGSAEYRWLVAGTANFRDEFIRNLSAWQVGIVRLFPNPFRGRVTVQFMVPSSEVRSVVFTLVDLRGRLVWKKTLGRELRTGLNTVIWNGSTIADGTAGSQTLLLRMKATGAHDRVVKTEERRLVLLR